jgi:multiple sugar transport system ATP-binding protein
VEPTGAETHITARLGEHEITIVSKSRLNARPGDTITVSLTSDQAHLFDAASGRRLAAVN